MTVLDLVKSPADLQRTRRTLAGLTLPYLKLFTQGRPVLIL
jgi:hypothetical protein